MSERIVCDPEIMGKTPCIRGTRITVSIILKLLANGETIEEVLEDYPELTREDVLACLGFAAKYMSMGSIPVE